MNSPEKILIVDDVALMRDLLIRELTILGFTNIHHASCGEEALELVASTMLRIRDEALFKYSREVRPDAKQLAGEVHRLRLQLGEARRELEAHRQIARELKERLYDLQEQCDKRESVMLGALITWLARRMNQAR